MSSFDENQEFRLEIPEINKTREFEKMFPVPQDFVAIDVETAIGKSRVCKIGLATVEGGKMVQAYSWLVKPPKNDYLAENIKIHGITPQITENSPSFTRLWKELEPLINNKIIAAHYAHFDLTAIMAAAKTSKKDLFIISILDSCIAARRAFPELENHQLPTVCNYLNIPLNHHDAGSDAIACAQILLEIGKSPNIRTEHVTDKNDYDCYFFNRPATPRKIWTKTWYEKHKEVEAPMPQKIATQSSGCLLTIFSFLIVFIALMIL